MPVASGAASAGCVRVGGDEALELGDELMGALGRQVEREQLDGDEPLALRIVRAKHRAQAFPHRSDEERETVRRRQEAQRRQRPCAVKNSSGKARSS